MTLWIDDTRITSDMTCHWAVPANPTDLHRLWMVSWLRDRQVTRNQAISAVTLAEAVAAMQTDGMSQVIDHTYWRWPLIDALAAELDLAGAAAVVRVCGDGLCIACGIETAAVGDDRCQHCRSTSECGQETP